MQIVYFLQEQASYVSTSPIWKFFKKEPLSLKRSSEATSENRSIGLKVMRGEEKRLLTVCKNHSTEKYA